jgi:capsid protein
MYFDNGYVGARSSTARSAIDYWVGDAAAELSSYTRAELMRKARYFRKNVGLARAMGSDIQKHAIGPGLFPIPDTGDAKRDEEYFEYFQQVQKIADVTGRETWYKSQSSRVPMKFFDGDSHVILSTGPAGYAQFQQVRSHNVGNFDVDANDERWTDGVKRSALGRRQAYRVKTRKSAKTIPAAFMLQAAIWDDPDGVRGASCLGHAISNLHDTLDLLALEKSAVRENSRVARVITGRDQYAADENEEPDFDAEVVQPALNNTPTTDLAVDRLYASELVRLADNESLESFTSNRPNATFTGFIDHLGRDISVGCGLPYEFSWNPSGLKSAATRSITEKINAACRMWQGNEEPDTVRFYQFVILAGIAAGHIRPHRNWWKVEVYPGAPEVSIDKGRDVRSDIDLVKAGLMTLKRFFGVRGLYWKQQASQAMAELLFYSTLKNGELALRHPSELLAKDALHTSQDLRSTTQDSVDDKLDGNDQSKN